MNFFRKELMADAEETRADVIIRKKRRKQDPSAKGLGAVAIARRGPRSVHQRHEDRHILEGTKARAQIDGREHEVDLLNLSSNGVMIGFDGKVDIGQEIRLVIAECAPITTAVRWVRRERIGLEFMAETTIIAEAGVQDFILKAIARENALTGTNPSTTWGAEQRSLARRHQIVWLGKLAWGTKETTARLRNISRTGAMVALAEKVALAEGANVALVLGAAGKVPAKIRWFIDGQVGLEFRTAFDLSQLIEEKFVELAPPDDSAGLAAPVETFGEEDFDVMNIRLGNVENPHQPPNMKYGRLTLDEVYSTLYPKGR